MKKIVCLLIFILCMPIFIQSALVGDVNSDNVVDTKDSILIVKHMINKGKLTGNSLKNADVNNDGVVDTLDYMKVKNIIIGKISPINVIGVSLNKKFVELKINKSETIIAKVLPTNADNTSVTWTSSNPSVASVINGKIKAHKLGKAVITVITNDGSKKAKCNVEVKAETILIEGNSKTYRPDESLKDTRPATQFISLAYDQGYLGLTLSSLVQEEKNVEGAYIAHNNEITIITKGGSTLLDKATTDPYKKYINNKQYDIVILQENGTYVTNNSYYQKFYDGVEKTLNLLGGSNFKGTLYIRTGWPYNSNDFYKELEIANTNTKKLVESIKNKYHISISIIYDGNAFAKAKEAGIGVYRNIPSDMHHQNNNGAYLAALCMYVKVYNEDATKVTNNLYVSDLNIAKKLKTIANATCRK